MSDNVDVSSLATTNTILVLAKIGSMLVLGVGSLVLGMLPLLFGRCRFNNRDNCRAVSSSNSSITNKTTSSVDASNQGLLTSLLLCFGGGVLLFTTFLHLAPEVRQSVERHQSNGQLMTLGTLSMAELLFCIGFFLVYLVEETVHATLTSKPEASSDLLYRTVSVRRCNKQSSLSSTTISSVTPQTTSNEKSSTFYQVGRFKYANEDRIERGMNDNDSKASTDCSTMDEIDVIKNGNNFGAIFVRSPNCQKNPEPPLRINEKKEKKMSNVGTIIENPKSTDTSVRGLLAVVALSFHAIFEGLAVGLEPSISSVVYLAAAIATHKLVIAFCVGMELYVTETSTRTILGYLSVFSMVTPLGIGVGLALGHFKNDSENLGPAPTILQGMAAGTLLYVVFFEVLARERANDKSGLLQLAAIIVGFMLMLGLQLATAHSHTHSHGHSHDGIEINGDGNQRENVKDHDHDHDHSERSDVRPINDAIGRITDSVAEAVSKAIMSSITTRSSIVDSDATST